MAEEAETPSTSNIFLEAVTNCSKQYSRLPSTAELNNYVQQKYNLDLNENLGDLKCVLRSKREISFGTVVDKKRRADVQIQKESIKRTKTLDMKESVKPEKNITVKEDKPVIKPLKKNIDVNKVPKAKMETQTIKWV